MDSIMPANELAHTFAENVRGLMEMRGWSQVELARRADLPQPRISEILGETRDYRLGTVNRIANAFGVSAVALLTPGFARSEKILVR